MTQTALRETPVAGVRYAWRASTGHDDLHLVERRPGLRTAVEVVERRAVDASGAAIDATGLPVGDVDALIVDLRRGIIGDRLRAEGGCSSCGSPVDVAFDLGEYCAHQRPRSSRLAEPHDEVGWFRLRASESTFRLPLAGDVLDAAADGAGEQLLVQRCVRGDSSPRAVQAAERAMASLGPTLRTDVGGTCPECNAQVRLDVDARDLCLEELRARSISVLGEVHLLASTYHWTEREILDLPTTRRTAYADHIRAGRGAPLSAEAFGG